MNFDPKRVLADPAIDQMPSGPARDFMEMLRIVYDAEHKPKVVVLVNGQGTLHSFHHI